MSVTQDRATASKAGRETNNRKLVDVHCNVWDQGIEFHAHVTIQILIRSILREEEPALQEEEPIQGHPPQPVWKLHHLHHHAESL